MNAVKISGVAVRHHTNTAYVTLSVTFVVILF